MMIRDKTAAFLRLYPDTEVKADPAQAQRDVLDAECEHVGSLADASWNAYGIGSRSAQAELGQRRNLRREAA